MTQASTQLLDATAAPGDVGRFRLFVEMMPQIAWMARADGTVDYCNHRWRQYTAIDPELCPDPFHDRAVHPTDLAVCRQAWSRALETGVTLEIECRLRRAADGAFRWHLCQACPMRDDGRQIVGWCGTFTDVDDRIQAMERLRGLERFLESIVDNIPDAIFVKAADDLRFVRINKAMAQLAGYPSTSVTGCSDYDFFPREEADFFTSNDRAVLASGTMLEIPEETMHTPRGVRLLHTKKIPVFDEQGKPQFLLGITRDITEERRASEALREKNRLLEEAVRAEQAAAAALKAAQNRLIQSEKLAALGELVAGVAHEINNPLAFVTNNMAVLQRDMKGIVELLAVYRSAQSALAAADPGAARRAEEVADRVDAAYTLENLPDLLARSSEGLRRIRQIVSDLREFSRHESIGDVQDDADVNAGINSTVNIVRGRARGQNVELELDLSPLPPVSCSPARINQVLLNLVANAIDACAGGGKVTIRSRPVGAGVEIEISDTGAGIAPDVIGRIFDPFFTTKPQGQGTGLGLSISHGIVTDHGGRITAQSLRGQGACFTVWLPLRGVRTG